MRLAHLLVPALAATGALAASEEDIYDYQTRYELSKEYTDWRLTFMPLPRNPTATVRSSTGNAFTDSRTSHVANAKTPIRTTIGFLDSATADYGRGVLVSGLGLGHELFIDDYGGSTATFRSFLLDGEVGFSRRFDWSPLAWEGAGILGVGLSRLHASGYRDSAGNEGSARGMGWAYDVGARFGLSWTSRIGLQVVADVRYLYHQITVSTHSADPAGPDIERKHTLTFNGPTVGLGVGWRF
jgi:hypothetical protein